MQPSDKQKPYLLSEEHSALIYNNLVSERFLKPLKPNKGKLPTAIYLAGQPGSGKTVLKNHLLLDPSLKASTLVINTDELREFHPAYKGLLAHPTNFAAAPFLVNPDSVKWAEQLRLEAVKEKHNLLFDVTLGGDSGNYIKSMNDLKNLGYEIYIAVLAVKKDLSRLGIHLRYERQFEADGSGRFVSMNVHDFNYKYIPDNLANIMKAVDLDGVSVFKRKIFEQDNKLVNNSVDALFEFNKVNGKHSIESSYDLIINTLNRERNRQWSPIEKEYIGMRIGQVEKLIDNRGGNVSVFREDIKDLIADISYSFKSGRKI